MQRLPLQPQDGFYLLRIHVLAALRPVPGQRCQPIPARAPPIFFLFHMAVLFFTVVLLLYCCFTVFGSPTWEYRSANKQPLEQC